MPEVRVPALLGRLRSRAAGVPHAATGVSPLREANNNLGAGTWPAMTLTGDASLARLRCG
jgi:hypothetical protein